MKNSILNSLRPIQVSCHVQGQRHRRLVRVRISTPTGQRSNFNPNWATQLGLGFGIYSRQSRQWIFSLVEPHVPSKVSRCPCIAPLFFQQRREWLLKSELRQTDYRNRNQTNRPSEIEIGSASARIERQTIEIKETEIKQSSRLHLHLPGTKTPVSSSSNLYQKEAVSRYVQSTPL